MRLVKPIQDQDLDHTIEQLDISLKGGSRIEEESDLLMSLSFLEPVCHVQILSSFRKIDKNNLFFGCWFQDTATGTYAVCDLVPDKKEFRQGFVVSHGGHYLFKGVYVGTTLRQLKEVKNALGIDVTDQLLRRLERYGETAYFVRPEFPQKCPVYELNDAKLAHVARQAGFVTQLEQPEKNQRKTRDVQVGDRLVLLPLNDTWMIPLGSFPPDGLPKDLYRRV